MRREILWFMASRLLSLHKLFEAATISKMMRLSVRSNTVFRFMVPSLPDSAARLYEHHTP